jgi:hypothetical protein
MLSYLFSGKPVVNLGGKMGNRNVPAYPLPPPLEKLWQEMQEVINHPRFWEAADEVDPRFRDAYIKILHMPRRWLADRRELQAKEALRAIRTVFDSFERK